VSRNAVEVYRPLSLALLCLRISVLFFFVVDGGYPYSVGTDSLEGLFSNFVVGVSGVCSNKSRAKDADMMLTPTTRL
jgi:hypothetical protein